MNPGGLTVLYRDCLCANLPCKVCDNHQNLIASADRTYKTADFDTAFPRLPIQSFTETTPGTSIAPSTGEQALNAILSSRTAVLLDGPHCAWLYCGGARPVRYDYCSTKCGHWKCSLCGASMKVAGTLGQGLMGSKDNKPPLVCVVSDRD